MKIKLLKRFCYAAIALLIINIAACNSLEKQQISLSSSESKPTASRSQPNPTRTNIAFFEGTYPPKPFPLVDAVEPESSFFEFRERLRTAVRDRDADYIRSIAISPIKLGFGVSPNSVDELEIDNPNAPFWQYLEKAIGTGCSDENRLYNRPASAPESWICPHVFAAGESIDRAEFGDRVFAWEVFILGENIPVYSEAKTDSPIITTLSNERALLGEETVNQFYASANAAEPQEARWYSTEGQTSIVLPNSEQGYVENRYLYDINGYRAVFSYQNGKWQMLAFVSGD
ncbi:hypothetical protein H6F67_00460 [Microcoleus sp. FACHB-1515]|uniref:hypothetical protein n=1 Tax=Cyanophyceae TaxID=3028117 RepID=UPI00168797B0|nr:hypothetical protein [Microcoleus sp. FACHB-1515]MBD2088348.1 hypothetical protein [Microcoleus sp. FACHB-1515]